MISLLSALVLLIHYKGRIRNYIKFDTIKTEVVVGKCNSNIFQLVSMVFLFPLNFLVTRGT